MKCPIDQTEMEEGMIADRGENMVKMKLQWGEKIRLGGIALQGAQDIVAYKCSKCGKVELQVQEKN